MAFDKAFYRIRYLDSDRVETNVAFLASYISIEVWRDQREIRCYTYKESLEFSEAARLKQLTNLVNISLRKFNDEADYALILMNQRGLNGLTDELSV